VNWARFGIDYTQYMPEDMRFSLLVDTSGIDIKKIKSEYEAKKAKNGSSRTD
jgi:hypothetical protein